MSARRLFRAIQFTNTRIYSLKVILFLKPTSNNKSFNCELHFYLNISPPKNVACLRLSPEHRTQISPKSLTPRMQITIPDIRLYIYSVCVYINTALRPPAHPRNKVRTITEGVRGMSSD